MSQRNWIILAVVVVVVLVGGYMYWPGTTGDTAIAPDDNAETTAPAE